MLTPPEARLLEALKATQFGFMLRRCPVCAGWNMSDHGETDRVHTPECPVGGAIQAAEGKRRMPALRGCTCHSGSVCGPACETRHHDGCYLA